MHKRYNSKGIKKFENDNIIEIGKPNHYFGVIGSGLNDESRIPRLSLIYFKSLVSGMKASFRLNLNNYKNWEEGDMRIAV